MGCHSTRCPHSSSPDTGQAATALWPPTAVGDIERGAAPFGARQPFRPPRPSPLPVRLCGGEAIEEAIEETGRAAAGPGPAAALRCARSFRIPRGEQKVSLCRRRGRPRSGAARWRRARDPNPTLPSPRPGVTAPRRDRFSVLFAVVEGCSGPGGWGAEAQ